MPLEEGARTLRGIIKRPVAGVTVQPLQWQFSSNRIRQSLVKPLFSPYNSHIHSDNKRLLFR
jgi:hypothetical protein